jgi:hypothetical protein
MFGDGEVVSMRSFALYDLRDGSAKRPIADDATELTVVDILELIRLLRLNVNGENTRLRHKLEEMVGSNGARNAEPG